MTGTLGTVVARVLLHVLIEHCELVSIIPIVGPLLICSK